MLLTPGNPQAQAPSAHSRPSRPQAVPRGSWGGSQAPSPGCAASNDHPPPQMLAAGQGAAEGSGPSLPRAWGGAACLWSLEVRCQTKRGPGTAASPGSSPPVHPAVQPQALMSRRQGEAGQGAEGGAGVRAGR